MLDVKLDEKLDKKLEPIKATVNSNAAVLDGLAKDVKKLLDEKTITVYRFERLENWGQKVGKKLDIKLEL